MTRKNTIMSLFRHLLLAVALAASALVAPARADSVSVGTTYSGVFSMIVDGNRVSEGGGNVAGSTGVINGTLINFAALYCVDQFTGAALGANYTTTYNASGVINGQTLAAAGQIAWLMVNIAPGLASQAQFQALQGLIWQLESPTYTGHVVQFDTNTAYNSPAAVGYFNSYVAALGSNVAPVSSVYWINPQNTAGQYAYQGFVAVASQPYGQTGIPEPASFAVLGAGFVGLAAVRRRRTR